MTHQRFEMREVNHARLPDFLAVGPPRTATTWLERMLTGRVGLPTGIKETDFFGRNYALGLSWYAAHFRDCPTALPAGEICPVYFDSPDARRRIAEHIPGARIIITLRDPVQRLYSHYRLLRREGWIGAISLEQALARDLGWNGPGNLHGSNCYAEHVVEWQRGFTAGRVLVLIHDDLVSSPQQYLSRVCDFIGIARFELNGCEADERVNTVERAPLSPRLARHARWFRQRLIVHRRYRILQACQPLWDVCGRGGRAYPPLAPDVEARLRASLRNEVEALEGLLERDLSRWKEVQRRAA